MIKIEEKSGIQVKQIRPGFPSSERIIQKSREAFDQDGVYMEVIDKIIRAYKSFLMQDAHLLRVDANERSMTHRFAIYLQDEFPEYNVDCEYNRIEEDSKEIGRLKKKLVDFKEQIYSDDENAVTVYPDIIVHHRGAHDNFIVIEAKKTKTSNRDIRYDLEKLKAYKNDLDYKCAFFVKFPVGESFKKFVEDEIEQYIQEI